MPARRANARSVDARPVDALVSLGPVCRRWLEGIGVRTVADLRAMGAVEAFGRVRAREGPHAATRNLLYGLHAALAGVHWMTVDEATKVRLCEAAGIAPPARRRGG